MARRSGYFSSRNKLETVVLPLPSIERCLASPLVDPSARLSVERGNVKVAERVTFAEHMGNSGGEPRFD
jgi:hypothetical protein